MIFKKQNVYNQQIIIFSSYFFLYFGAVGFVQPFIILNFYSIGMTGWQIGLFTTIISVLTLFIVPLMGVFYDKTIHKRGLFKLYIFLSGISLFLIGWIRSYWLLILFYSINRICNSSCIPISEVLAYNINILNGKKSRNRFGFIRQFGSLGFAFTAVLGGWILDNSQIRVNFLLHLLLMLLVIVIISFISDQLFNSNNEEFKHKEESYRFRTVLKAIYSDKYLTLMVIALALTNPLGSGIQQFEPIFMAQLNISETMIGLAATLSALFEIPFMLLADKLITRLGITRILIFVFTIDLFRRLLVWIFPFGSMVFIMNVATSISFSLRLVTTVSLINQHVPKKYSTTALSLVTMTLFGLSNMLNNTISGILFDSFGGRVLYLTGAITCIISLGLAVFAGNIVKISSENKKQHKLS